MTNVPESGDVVSVLRAAAARIAGLPFAWPDGSQVLGAQAKQIGRDDKGKEP
jgi:hypothetical protein